MKRNSWILLLVFGFVISFTACKEDDNPPAVTAPTITGLSPATGMVGDEVTISGTNFSTTAASNTVQFGTTNATVSTATATSLKVAVPQLAAGEYDVKVTVGSETATFATKFTVTETEPTEVLVTDADLADGTYEWTADKSYLLDGLVFLEAGGVLNIEPGTVIRFMEVPTDPTFNTSSLIITKGAQIMAEGTAENPIIFTAEADVEGATLDPIADNAQWGGLIILGDAPASLKGVTENVQIEGIATSETRAAYGGSTSDDNSGVLKYVSIRYTGIGLAAGDEIQGLTLGGVGSGTTIDYVDIYSSADDGIEVFGGMVNLNHISVAFATDDAFDFDLGYRGNAQFLFGLEASGSENEYDHSGEWDGADPDDATLFSAPNIFNATFIGPGQTATGSQRALMLRESFAGKLGNSILEDYPGIGMQVQDRQSARDAYGFITTPVDGYTLEILDNTWSMFGGYDAAVGTGSLVEATEGADEGYVGETADVVAELDDNANKYSAAAILGGISRDPDGVLDPRPPTADTEVATVPEGMEQVEYRGAFAPGQPTWLSGWSTLSKLGYLVD